MDVAVITRVDVRHQSYPQLLRRLHGQQLRVSLCGCQSGRNAWKKADTPRVARRTHGFLDGLLLGRGGLTEQLFFETF